jgi:hypothetical protein
MPGVCWNHVTMSECRMQYKRTEIVHSFIQARPLLHLRKLPLPRTS